MTPPLRHRVRGRSWLRVAALSLSAWFCSCSRHLDDMSHLSVCLSVCLCVCVCVCVRARLWLYGGGVHDYVYSIIMSRLAGRRRRR